MSANTLSTILQDETGTLSAALDLFGPPQGSILYRDVAMWKALAPGTAGQVLTTGGPSANPSWGAGGGGGGTVTSVSIVGANGFAGTVATPTTTPAITLTTSISGILQGNGTAISAASTSGSGAIALVNSPSFTTPILGAATGASLALNGATSGSVLLQSTAIASGTLTLPNGNDTLIGRATTDTISGPKTFNPNMLLFAGSTSGTTLLNATALASGTLTLPAATDTLVARNTTDTLSNKTFSDQPSVRLNLTVPTYVATVGALQALNPTKDTVAVLTASGIGGTFIWTSGNFSTQVTADTTNAIYIAANSVASTSGAWIRQYSGALNVFWFGAKGDGSTNDEPAFAAAYALCKVIGSGTTEGPCGSVWGPPGYRYAWGGSLGLDVPVNLKIEGEILYTPTSAAAIIVGVTLHTARGNTQYDIDLNILRAVNGNTSNPTGINTSGSIGVELRDCQFSRISIKEVIAFTYSGLYGNATNNVFTGQQVQDNTIYLDEAAFCGVGLLAQSVSASQGSFQVNKIYTQNVFANWNNIVLGKSGDGNTNNNMLFLGSSDADTGGGNIILWCSYNFIQAGYINGTVTLQSSTFYNLIYHQVGNAQCTVSDSGTGNLIKDNVEGTLSQERWQTSGLTPLQVIQSTATGATVANLVDLYRNNTGAANNEGVSLSWSFNNSTPAKFIGVELESSLVSPTAGGEYARLRVFNRLGGVRTNVANLYQGWAVGASATDQGIGTVNVSGNFYVAGTAISSIYFPLTGGTVAGSLLSSGSTGVGYATGAGGTVTQATSKTTGVTLNKVSGQITMNSAALAAAAKVSFVVTNSTVAATDIPVVNIVSGGTANAYRANVTATAAGSFTVTVENITAGSLSEAPIVGFAVIKGVTA